MATRQAPLLSIELPTFSADTDWNSNETQIELFKAVTEIGFGYWMMDKNDKKLYNKAFPKIRSWFRSTLEPNNTMTNNLPDLNEYQLKNINYGYSDRTISVEPLQMRTWIIPIHEPSFMNHPTNPFKHDKDIQDFGNNLVKHCQTFFHHTLKSYFKANKELNKHLDNLEYHKRKLFGDNPCKHYKFIYYNPDIPVKSGKKPSGGIHPHIDFGGITFLLPSCEGLQVYYNNKWWNVPCYKDRFIFNFGSALQATSNNKWKAGLHRVPAMHKERLSIAMFYNPDLNGDLYGYDEKNGDLKKLKPFKDHFWGEFANPYQQPKRRSKL